MRRPVKRSQLALSQVRALLRSATHISTGAESAIVRNRSLASRSFSSARFWAVMSRATFEAATMLPAAFRTGDTQSEISSRVPSLCTPHRLKVVDPLAAPNPREYVGFFVQELRGNQDRDRLAYGLCGGVAEQARRTRHSRLR